MDASLAVESEVEHVMHGVYIEDTDCYNVVYYANYFKFFARALQEAVGLKALAALLYDDGITLAIHSIDQGKYATAATLGSAVTVKSKLLAVSPTLTKWEQQAVDPTTGKAFVSAEIGMAFLDRDGAPVPVPSTLNLPAASDDSEISAAPLEPFTGEPNIVTPTMVYADEVGPTGLLSLEAILRYFERNRTDLIGGADGLKELQEAGVMVVVARMNSAEFAVGGTVGLLGETVTACSIVELQRRNTMVVFKQMVYHGEQLLAKAEITCVCIGSENMRICACPEPIAARMLGSA